MKTEFEEIKSSLEIEEHVDMHKRGFPIQGIGIFLIMLIVVAAALGVFGDGMLSAGVLSSRSATVKFEKYYRHEARMEFNIMTFDQQRSVNVVSFPGQYLKDVEIQAINPSPMRSSFNKGRTEFQFEGTGNTRITFMLIPRKVGSISGTIQVNDDSFGIDHFIYP
jgi:hypothetical protein